MSPELAKVGRSPLLRLVLFGVLTLVLQIPVAMIGDIVRARQQSRADAAAEIARSWGSRQEVAGPFLVVPYGEAASAPGWQLGHDAGHVVLAPETLEVQGRLGTETRRRGLFELPVYRAELNVTGRFRPPGPDVQALLPRATPRWNEARLVLRLGDVHAIDRVAPMQWNGRALELQPGGEQLGAGLHAVPGAVVPGDAAAFRIDLELRGSEALHLVAAGRSTRASLQSGWPHPAFRGAWLPRLREVGPQGFTASWEVPAVARGLPAAWKIGSVSDEQLAQARFGVDLLFPVDPYRMSERSLKYSALFIGLAFLVIWLVETLTRRRMHPVHAVLLGAALCLFYLLELSLAEQLGFAAAYLLASAAVTLQVSLYARAALAGTRPAVALAAVVAALYGLLFLLLREEDYALLIGSASLFAALSVVMSLTRRIASVEPLPGP